MEFCHSDIKEVYHTLFDEALERCNAKQKRSERKIDNYYEKIRLGKQEKLFYEVIFQIGNKDDMNVQSNEGQLAEPGALMDAKNYRDKKALPPVEKLKEVVKNLTIKCVQLTEQGKKLTAKVDGLERTGTED